MNHEEGKSEGLNTNEDRIDRYMDKTGKTKPVGKEEWFGFKLPTEQTRTEVLKTK